MCSGCVTVFIRLKSSQSFEWRSVCSAPWWPHDPAQSLQNFLHTSSKSPQIISQMEDVSQNYTISDKYLYINTSINTSILWCNSVRISYTFKHFHHLHRGSVKIHQPALHDTKCADWPVSHSNTSQSQHPWAHVCVRGRKALSCECVYVPQRKHAIVFTSLAGSYRVLDKRQTHRN